jgi:hypothetical protein
MVYSTGCVAEDSWRRGGWCALVGIGFLIMGTQPPTERFCASNKMAIEKVQGTF